MVLQPFFVFSLRLESVPSWDAAFLALNDVLPVLNGSLRASGTLAAPLMKDSAESIGRRILVVDDDPSVGSLLAEALQAEGYDPVTCLHPSEALSASEREGFDLAFVDINLPGMSGLALAATLKDRNPGGEVVFITGHGSLEIAVQAIKLGAYDYLSKPFSLNEFRLCLKRFQERQGLREKARLAERRYYQLVHSIPLLIYVLNPNLQLDYVNEACSKILGFTPEEAMKSPQWFLRRVHPGDRERLREAFRKAFSIGKPVSMECRFLHRDKRPIHVILESIPQVSGDSQSAGDRLEGFIVDITDRVFLERALIQKEKVKTLGTIAAEVAHEIRNPLVCIGGFARRLQKKFPELPECRIILKESERLEKILSRIRNYLRPVEIHPKECSVNSILCDSVDLLSPEMQAKQVKCSMELDPGLEPLRADPDVLTEIFLNLIRNAMEAVQKGEALTFMTYQGDQELNISFRNHFAGPPVRDPEALFMPFAEGGRSIGLPLCYRLVKDMGGLLSFSQEGDDWLFTVSLPKPHTP